MSRLGPLATLLACLLASGAWAERFQPDVAAGRIESLDAARVEIQKRLAAGDANESQVAAWRYDWAYLNWRIAQSLRGVDDKRRKLLLKQAEKQLDLLLDMRPESAEAWALRGSTIGDRIDGGFSAAMLGRKASANHKQAAELDADNPRVALLRGIGMFFTPRTFGGGREAAEAELRRANVLFESQASTTSWPSWGREDALAWLGVVVAERGEAEVARELYDRALEVRPEYLWIRETLIPGLDAD